MRRAKLFPPAAGGAPPLSCAQARKSRELRRTRAAQEAARGFTLIEVIVALSILAVMTTLTAGAIRSAIQTRARTTGIIQRESTVRDALRVIERDVNVAFHYRAVSPENAPATGAAVSAGTGPNGAAPAPTPMPTPTPTPDPNKKDQITAFVGEKDRMDFTALSHVRTTRDAIESDQEEVGYYLASCRARKGDKPVETSCVWRRHNSVIDDEVTKDGEATVLVEYVTEFKLRYIGPDKEDWLDSWKSDKTGDESMRDKFPYAVEVTLKVQDKNDPNSKPVAMTMVAEIRFPNNAPKKTDPNAQPGATGQPGTQTPASTQTTTGTGVR